MGSLKEKVPVEVPTRTDNVPTSSPGSERPGCTPTGTYDMSTLLLVVGNLTRQVYSSDGNSHLQWTSM